MAAAQGLKKATLRHRPLARAQSVQRQHGKHAAEEDLPPEACSKPRGHLLEGEQQAADGSAEGHRHAYARACTRA